MNSRFSAVLLAGGKSSRMGQDKAFIEVDGQPLWQRQLRILRALEPRELFIAGPRRTEWMQKGGIVVPDVCDDAGPIAGLISALCCCSTPLLLALAVDLPRMTSDYLRELLTCCTETRGVIPRGQPLAAVYPVGTLALARRSVEARNYAMQEFAMQCVSEGLAQLKDIGPNDEPVFLNMNKPEDLRALSNA